MSHGADARLALRLMDGGSARWTMNLLAGRSRARQLDASLPDYVTPLIVPVRHTIRGGRSLTQLTNIAGDSVSDMAPDLLLAWRTDLSWRGWRLTTQLDGEWGGDMAQATRRGRDQLAMSPLPDGGRARFLTGTADASLYLQRGTYTALREVVLSRSLGRMAFVPEGSRVELTGRNLLVWSDLEILDPSARLQGTLAERGLVLNQFPRMRSVAVSLVVGFDQPGRS